jgi:hypothetical protein
MRYAYNKKILTARANAGDDVAMELELLAVRFRHEWSRLDTVLSMVPDMPSDIRTIEKHEYIAARTAARHARRFAERQAQDERWRLANERVFARLVQGPPVEFHEDNQNIHLTVTVVMVKQTIQKVIAIPVPAEYRWNMDVTSKTLGEIIAECKISPAAARLMAEKYTSNETVYDMVPGIYGKTLDSVWQFVKEHPDKEQLIKTLKTELEDNIGMCVQGNLTRLCNVLQGYIDGLSVPPIAEILGDLLPPLAEIEDREVRRESALQIMRTHNVPEDQQDEWLEPLMS